jgi:hypothetical protein
MSKKNPTPKVELSTLILFSIVLAVCFFMVYVFFEVKTLNQQLLDIDNATISARTSYFLQAKEDLFMAEAVSDFNNKDDFKKVLYQAPKVMDISQPIPIKARIWGKVKSVTFTLKDSNGNVLGSLLIAGAGSAPAEQPKINTRYLNALHNVETEEELEVKRLPETTDGVLFIEENDSLDPVNKISQSSHAVKFENIKR